MNEAVTLWCLLSAFAILWTQKSFILFLKTSSRCSVLFWHATQIQLCLQSLIKMWHPPDKLHNFSEQYHTNVLIQWFSNFLGMKPFFGQVKPSVALGRPHKTFWGFLRTLKSGFLTKMDALFEIALEPSEGFLSQVVCHVRLRGPRWVSLIEKATMLQNLPRVWQQRICYCCSPNPSPQNTLLKCREQNSPCLWQITGLCMRARMEGACWVLYEGSPRARSGPRVGVWRILR